MNEGYQIGSWVTNLLGHCTGQYQLGCSNRNAYFLFKLLFKLFYSMYFDHRERMSIFNVDKRESNLENIFCLKAHSSFQST